MCVTVAAHRCRRERLRRSSYSWASASMPTGYRGEAVTLRDYLKIARRWWWLVVVGCVLSGVAAYLVSSRITEVYQAKAVLLVNTGGDLGGSNVTYDQNLLGQNLTRTYAQLVRANTHLQLVSDELKDTTVKKLQSSVSAAPIPETLLIEIFAKDKSPERAAFIANTMARTFPGYIQTAQLGTTNPDVARRPNTVYVSSTAVAPESPVEPNTGLNVFIGVFLGLLVTVGAVALVEYLDDGIDEREDVERMDVAFLGSVFQASPPKGVDRRSWVPSIIESDPRSPLAESYRQVQANLAFALSATECRVLLVTSPGQGEGKSTTAANLAEALAESSKKVLLIDGDLRKPDAHRYFSLPNNSGLTSTFLVDPQSLLSFVDRVGDSLAVLTGGPVPPNPTELISSAKMRHNIAVLREPYDVVIIDSPPMLGLADATIWSNLVDGVVVVARSGKTRRGPFEETIAAVRATRKPLLGVVLNGSSRRKTALYAYRYGGYGQEGSTE